MRPPPRGFAVEEYRARAGAAQRLMAEQGIDLLWFSTEAELYYFGGFHSPFWLSPTRCWHLLLPRRGEPLAVLPAIGEAAFARSWVRELRSFQAPSGDDRGERLLLDAIKQHCPAAGALGTPMGAESQVRLPLVALDALRAGLGARSLVDASPLVRALRGRKSAAEIAKIRHCCSAAGAALHALPGQLRAGQPLREAFRQLRQSALAAGVDEVPYLVGGAGAGGYDDIISPPGDAPLAAGQVLVLDTGCTWDGYFCDFDRNASVGPPSAAVAAAHEALWSATEAGFAACRPGATAAEVHAAMHAALGPLAGDGIGRMGHGLGLQLTEWPSLAPFDHTALVEGMVLTLEPSANLAPGRSLVHEENLVVTAAGAQWLSPRAPREMARIALD